MMEKITSNDHDLLISLSTKVDLLLSGQKENFATMSSQISAIDLRTRAIEKLDPDLVAQKLETALGRIESLEQTVHDLTFRYKTTVALAGGIGSAVGLAISFIVNYLKLIR